MTYSQSNETPSTEIVTQGQENLAVDRGLQPQFSHDVGRLQAAGNIILGDFVLNQIDNFGNAWVLRDLEGWWEPPTADVPNVTRGFGDGGYNVRGRYRERTVTVSGSILPSSPKNIEAARDRLVAALSGLPRRGVWFKTGSDPIRASFVTLDGDVAIETRNLQGRVDFSFSLRAVDPIKYAWNDASPDGYELFEIPAKNSLEAIDGTGVVENIGNYPVPVYFEISGPFAGPGTIFNRATQELIIITQSLKGPISRTVVNKQLTFNVEQLSDIATLTTTEAHDFSVGNSVFISGIGAPFDGDKLITATPTNTTFSFVADAAEVTPIAFKSLSNGIATIRTTEPHGLSAGGEIVVAGVDSVFNGTHTILGTPTTTSITFTQNRVPPRGIVSGSLISNIATINTADTHQFIVGETVVISGAGSNFDGTFEITAVPSDTSFTYANTRTNARDIVAAQMFGNDEAVLTASTPHGFVAGENVNVSDVNLTFNGGYRVNEVTTPTDFIYSRERATQKKAIIKARSSNVATITTSQPHGFVIGEKVEVRGVVGGYVGFHTITQLPSATTFSYANTGSNQVSTTVPNGIVRSVSRKISSILLAGNKVTVTTHNTHGAFINENIIVTGIGAPFDGEHKVVGIPFLNVLEFDLVAPNEALREYPVDEETGVSPNVFVEMTGTIDQFTISPPGQAQVGGSLPLTALSGTAAVSDEIEQTQSGGNVIKTNDVQFTPGLTGASAIVQADILEIDTQNREVAFNGEVEGARGRVDVLADFIRLAPGPNEIEFIDNGNPDSPSALRIFYRSGWLS